MQTSVERVKSGEAAACLTGTRLFSGRALLAFDEKDCRELNADDGNRPGIRINNEWLYPDESTAYVEFKLCYSWPSISAYRVAAHPLTVARNYRSMRNKVFNEAHRMKAYDTSKEKNEIPRDRILGCVVGVELNNAPHNATLPETTDKAPHIRAVAAIFKNAEGVPRIMGEHLSGRHVWTVSQESDYNFLESGFVLAGDAKKKSVRDMLEKTTPPEFRARNLWYIPVLESWDDLINTYSFEKRRVVADFEGMSVVVMKAGIGGPLHYGGVGMVKFGAERTAEIEKVLASDPDALEHLMEGDYAGLLEVLKNFQKNSEKLLTDLASAVLPPTVAIE